MRTGSTAAAENSEEVKSETLRSEVLRPARRPERFSGWGGVPVCEEEVNSPEELGAMPSISLAAPLPRGLEEDEEGSEPPCGRDASKASPASEAERSARSSRGDWRVSLRAGAGG